MTILEQVKEMKNQGIGEGEIIRKLQEQGTTPKIINDALNQDKIKEAVSKEESFKGYEKSENLAQTPKKETPPKEISNEEMYSPQQEEDYYSPPTPSSFPQEDYSQDQEDYAYSQGVDTNTIIEISEQIFSEKIQKIQDQVDEFLEFKTLAESKIENISGRIKRIESIIDKLQIAILEKIGGYGSGIESVKKEMSMMQDSFSKVINPLTKKAGERHSKEVHNAKVQVKRQIKKIKKR